MTPIQVEELVGLITGDIPVEEYMQLTNGVYFAVRTTPGSVRERRRGNTSGYETSV